ncbi:hypothetical protein ACVWWJ_002332 [Luteibacter sp. HA06]|jgi:hypothetical protein
MIAKTHVFGTRIADVVEGSAAALVKAIESAHDESAEFLLLRLRSHGALAVLKRAIAILDRNAGVEEARVQELMLQAITPPPPPANALRLMEMAQDARRAAVDSTEWLKATDIAARSDRAVRNPSTVPNRWKTRGRIFAINLNGADLFPWYGLQLVKEDDKWVLEPKPALEKVLKVLKVELSGWEIAEWFASHNGYLSGERPIDVLDTDLEAVVRAAEAEVAGVTHG